MGVVALFQKKLTILFKVLLSHCATRGVCKWLLNTIEGTEFYFSYIFGLHWLSAASLFSIYLSLSLATQMYISLIKLYFSSAAERLESF